MNITFPHFTPAFRTMAGLQIIRGPTRFDILVGPNVGWYLKSTRTALIPEVFGPFTYADFHRAPSLIGYRIGIKLDFALVETDLDRATGTYGLGLLQRYWSDGFMDDQASYKLQFNLYYGYAGSVYRTIHPTTNFAPALINDKQVRGVELQLEFETRDIEPQIPASWEAYQW